MLGCCSPSQAVPAGLLWPQTHVAQATCSSSATPLLGDTQPLAGFPGPIAEWAAVASGRLPLLWPHDHQRSWLPALQGSQLLAFLPWSSLVQEHL